MKAWRNPRQVIIHQALAEPADVERVDRLIVLLATGIERLLTQQGEKSPESVDFQSDLSPNTCTCEETAKKECA
jgi:copper homeostasis protein CutC